MASGDWDPMMADYQDPQFNAYIQGVGRDLTHGDRRGSKLFVDNFPVELGQEGLFNLFSEFGRVLHAQLKPSNRKDGNMSFGFVTMDSAVAAEQAINMWHQRPLNGVHLKVLPAMTEDQKNRKKEKRQMEADFMATLGRSSFHREDDMISSVSTFSRQPDLRNEHRDLTAKAQEILRRARIDYDMRGELGSRRSELDAEEYFSIGRGRAHANRGSAYFRGVNYDYPGTTYGGGMGRGRGRGWSGENGAFNERPFHGPSQRMNAGHNFGRGSMPQMNPPIRLRTPNLKICVHCGIEDSTFRCQACKSYYCSHNCQRKDWQGHKDFCLDINVHHFNLKYNPRTEIDNYYPMPSNVLRQHQNHPHYEDRNTAVSNHSGRVNTKDNDNYHSDNEGAKPSKRMKNFKQQNKGYDDSNTVVSNHSGKGNAKGNDNYHSDNEGSKPSKSMKNFKQDNRGYESEAVSGIKRNQNKVKSFNNKHDNKARNSYDQPETTRREHHGRNQEKNTKFKNKPGQNDWKRKEDKVFNRNGGYKNRDEDNVGDMDRTEPKVFYNSNDNFDRGTRPQRDQTEKRDSDRNTRPLKFDKNAKDRPGQDRAQPMQKPPVSSSGDFDFNSMKNKDTEKRKLPKKDARNSNDKMEENRNGRTAMNSFEDACSGDASSDLASQAMDVGSSQKCHITHYESPSKFWISLTEDVFEFLRISHDLTQLLNKIDKVPIKKVKAGDLYCMIYHEEWVRVKIVTVSKEGNLTVFFPDIGNIEVISISDLIPLEESMRMFPAQAMCCCIGNAKPKGGKMWNEKTKLVVQEWLGQPYTIEFTCKVVEKRGNTHALDISSDGENLSEFLISEGLAEPSGASANLPRLPTDNQATSSVGTTRLMAKDLKSAGASFEEDEKISISIIEAEALPCITAHVINKTVKDIEGIMDGLNLDNRDPYSPIQGELVLAKYHADNKWYRSEVSRVNGDKFRIVFVDYGNRDEVTVKQIRPIMDKRLATFPALSTSLIISGLNPDITKDARKCEVFGQLLEEFAVEEGKWSVIIKTKNGSSTFIDFVSWAKEQTLSQLLTEKLSPTKKFPVRMVVSPEQSDTTTSASSSSLSYQTLSAGTSEVLVNFVNDCSSFYVMAKSNWTKLNSVMCKIRTHVNSLPLCEIPVVDGFVLAEYALDQDWYRGVIRSVSTNKQKCTVFFVDYGNLEEVSVENLRQLPQWALMEPAMAVHCSLDVSSVKLSPDADATFKSLEYSEITVLLLRKEDGGNKCVIKILTNDGSDLLSAFAAEEPGKSGQGSKPQEPRNSQSTPKDTRNSQTASTSKDTRNSQTASTSKDTRNSQTASTSKDTRNSQTASTSNDTRNSQTAPTPNDTRNSQTVSTPKDTRNSQTASTPKDTRISQTASQETKQSGSAACGADKQLIPESLPPVSNQPVEIVVSHIQNVCEIYIGKSNEQELITFMAHLQPKAEDEPYIQDVKVDDLCIVQFKEDDYWYRGQVTCCKDESKTCTVKFIDYGNSQQETPKEELKTLPDCARSLPIKAIPCCFKEFEDYLGQDPTCQDLDAINHTNPFFDMRGELTSAPSMMTVHSHKSGVAIVTLMDRDGNNMLNKYKIQAPGSSMALSSRTSGPSQVSTSQAASQPTTAFLRDIPTAKLTDSSFEIILTTMERLSDFFCQKKENDVEKAIEISQTLGDDLANVGPGLCHPVKRGGVYGCLFEESWYRCVVEEVKTDSVGIQYIDFGNRELRNPADLRPLQTKHLLFPVTLMKCKLHGVEIVENDDTMEDIKQYIQVLHEKAQNSNLWVDVVKQQDDYFLVSLSIVMEGSKVSLVEDLVSIGIATAVDMNGEQEEEEEEGEEDDDRKLEELRRQLAELEMKKNKKKAQR